MDNNAVISVIMPCFNVADTLRRAVDSILMQRVNAPYEIIIIDDCSTDNTAEIALEYVAEYPNVRYFKNEVNSGNSHSFFRGLTEASGDYFCVLDGDDYYTIPDKFERHLAFFETDIEQEYVATATSFVLDFGDGTVHIPNRPGIKEFNYSMVLANKHVYCHTATYMYRNIFKGNVLKYFDMQLYRGDTPRMLFHTMYSGKKVRILDFVGSAYSYTYSGIWSAHNEKHHFAYQINFYKNHKKNVNTDLERKAADLLIDRNQQQMDRVDEEQLDHYPRMTIEEALREVKLLANKFAFKERDYMLKSFYSSEYLDTLIASLGYIARENNSALKQRETNENNVFIFISVLNPGGGGIFPEIMELANMYSHKNVYIVQANESEVKPEAQRIVDEMPHVTILSRPSGCKEPFDWISRKVVEYAPYRAYYYCSHNDVYSPAVMDDEHCENICLFSFDHGYITGIHNPYLNNIAVKRSVDYRLLSRKLRDKLTYIPAWSEGYKKGNNALEYVPFNGHDKLITASGAARFYKLDGEGLCSYKDLIPEMLAETGGIHYHFGPIPMKDLRYIQNLLKEKGVPVDRFVHIEWSSDLIGDCLANHVDIFIEPFPVVSFKLTLNILSAGIPVIAWRAINRMSITDFVPESTLFWSTEEEFIEQLKNLDAATLEQMSKDARKYWEETHEFEVVKDYVINNKSMKLKNVPPFADDIMQDITDSLAIFDMRTIAVMQRLIDERRRVARLKAEGLDIKSADRMNIANRDKKKHRDRIKNAIKRTHVNEVGTAKVKLDKIRPAQKKRILKRAAIEEGLE